jgi:hypothetical protein
VGLATQIEVMDVKWQEMVRVYSWRIESVCVHMFLVFSSYSPLVPEKPVTG